LVQQLKENILDKEEFFNAQIGEAAFNVACTMVFNWGKLQGQVIRGSISMDDAVREYNKEMHAAAGLLAFAAEMIEPSGLSLDDIGGLIAHHIPKRGNN
jgi:hypothetical protein